jgi:hypothetical protein
MSQQDKITRGRVLGSWRDIDGVNLASANSGNGQ